MQSFQLKATQLEDAVADHTMSEERRRKSLNVAWLAWRARPERLERLEFPEGSMGFNRRKTMGKPWEKGGFMRFDWAYPLVMTHRTMDNHHFQWKNALEMVMFDSYVDLPRRVSTLGTRKINWRFTVN